MVRKRYYNFRYLTNMLKIKSCGSDRAQYCNVNQILLGDSRNYMPPILVLFSAKRIVTQILVIAKLNGGKDFILRVFVV